MRYRVVVERVVIEHGETFCNEENAGDAKERSEEPNGYVNWKGKTEIMRTVKGIDLDPAWVERINEMEAKHDA